MQTYEFDAPIIRNEDVDSGFIEFPYDVEKEFGTKGRVKVVVWFDSCEYRGSLVKMGYHCHIVGLTQQVRKAIGKNPGDTVHVMLQKDENPRVVELPSDFLNAISADAGAQRFFDGLSYTNKKAFVSWIEGAKKDETRRKRVAEAVAMLREGRGKG